MKLLDADALARIVMPARASEFNSIKALMNSEALAGIAMPAKASVFNSIDTLMNVEALGGFVPKGPNGFFWRSLVCL